MDKQKLKTVRRTRRRMGLRKRIRGTPEKPRLAVYRSLRHIYAQVIDDMAGRTIVAASSQEEGIAGQGKRNSAAAVGAKLAERAKAAGITQVCFDRAGFKFHGRIKSLAEGARKGGLKF